MDKVLKIGVIGCGQIAQIMHLPYLQELDSFEIYSLCDLSPFVLKKLGEKYCVPTQRRYTDIDEMLSDPVLDAVVIATRDHYEAGVKAAKAKKHMLVEKPLAQNLAQADEIISHAKENGVVLLVGYMKRYDPAYCYALKKIKSMQGIQYVRIHDFGGSFDFTTDIYDLYAGNDIPQEVMDEGMQRIHAARLQQIGAKKEALAFAYGTLLGLTSHDTILMRHAFGMGEVLFADARNDGFVTAVLDYKTFRCTIESGLSIDRRVWDENIYVYAPSAELSIHFPWPYLKNSPTVVRINENEKESMINVQKQVKGGYREAYKQEWLHFYDCIVHNAAPCTPGEDARQDIVLADKIIEKACL